MEVFHFVHPRVGIAPHSLIPWLFECLPGHEFWTATLAEVEVVESAAPGNCAVYEDQEGGDGAYIGLQHQGHVEARLVIDAQPWYSCQDSYGDYPIFPLREYQ